MTITPKAMPQEIEVWYILPSIRKELAKIFIRDYGQSQREVSTILGITEGAVSQYVRDKRAKGQIFSPEDVKTIEKTAKKIIKDKSSATKLVYGLTKRFRNSKTLCDVHRRFESGLSVGCEICK